MREKDVLNFSIKKKTVIDEDAIYGVAGDWADGLNIDLTETEHKAKGDLSIKWEGEKKQSHYVKSLYSIELGIEGRTPVEIVKDGKKQKMTKATVKIKIASKMITDYDEKWEETEFRKMYEKFHDKFIVSAHVRKHKKEIEAWTAQLFDAYKEVLEVEA